MKFASIRIITEDPTRLTTFYEKATGRVAEWLHPEFAQLVSPAATLAIAGSSTVQMLGVNAPRPGANSSVILEFEVDDVDGLVDRIKALTVDVLLPPTTMPWGNRSMLFRDPDGNLVNFFSRPDPTPR